MNPYDREPGEEPAGSDAPPEAAPSDRGGHPENPPEPLATDQPSVAAMQSWMAERPTEDAPSYPERAYLAPAAPMPGAFTRSRLHAWKDEAFAWARTLFSAAVYATIIVTFGFQVARVEGQSMAPTLADQDRLIVNKLAYRLGSPRRGDIVMLYYPADPDKSFVKRVIAEEGDTVKIEDGRVYINDVPMAEDFVPPEYRGHDDQPPMVIRSGYYYVLGDHRNNSSDSRHWGEVPKRYIIGKVQLRWWPIPNATIFRNP